MGAPSLSQALSAQLADRALQFATPATIPYVQRSAYLADALQSMQRGGGNIRTGGALASNLLAEALLQFSKGKADKALLGQQQKDQDSYANFATAGLSDPTQPASPGGPPAPGAPPAAAPAPMAPTAAPAIPADHPVVQALAAASAPQGGVLGQPVTPQSVQAVESGGNPNAVSPAGARGPMQIMPGTGQNPGFGVQPLQNNSPQENQRMGADYLQAMTQKYGGNQVLGAIAYNWGPGNTDKWLASGADPRHLPAETRNYVSSLALQGVHGPQAQQPQGPSPFANPAPAPNPGPVQPPPAPPQQPGAGGASPPTGQGPTPQEWQMIQSYIHSPYPQLRQQGAEMAMKIKQRMAAPIDPTKPMWDAQQGKYVQPPGLSFQDVPGAAPNTIEQRGPDGQIHVTANPAYGALPPGAQMQGDGSIRPAGASASNGRRVLTPQEVQQAGYAPGTVVELDPMTGQRTVQQDPYKDLTQRLQTSRDSFRTNDDVKKANEGIAAYNGLSTTLQQMAGGNNGVLDTAAVDSYLRGINPGMGAKNTTVSMFLNHLGLPQEIQGHIESIVGNGYLTPQTIRQMLDVVHSYASAHVAIAQNLSTQDLAAFKGYGVTPDQLGENLTSFVAPPHVKWLDGPGQPLPPAEDPYVTEARRRGLVK